MALSERLQFILEVNNKSAVKGLQEVGTAADKALGDADAKLDKLGSTLTKVGAGAVAFAGVAGAALWRVGGIAGDQNAAVAAMEQSFGDASTSIMKFADSSVRAAGLSKTAALEATTSFAGIARQMGLTGEAAANFAIQQTQLAADLAAFKNVSPEQALQDLVAAYSGSTEVMQKYQVSLNDTILKQTLLAETGQKVTGTLTPQQKALAIQATLIEQTATMQGQWNREIDSNEAKAAMFKASLDNLAAGIGQGVVPVMSQLLDGANGVVSTFNNLPPAAQGAIGSVAGFGVAAAGSLGAVSLIVGQTIKMRDNLGPLIAKLKDAEGGLNRWGKAAKGAGLGLAALAASDIVFDVLNQASGNAGNLERKLQALTGAIKEVQGGAVDGEAAMRAFRDSVAAEGKGLKVSNLWEDFGKEIKIVGGDIGRNVEEIDRAFKKVLEQDPSQAEALLGVWRDQAAQLDHNTGQYRDNIDAIEKYQHWLDLETVANASLTDSSDELAAAKERLAQYEIDHGDAVKATVSETLKANPIYAAAAERTERQARQTEALNDALAQQEGLAEANADAIDNLKDSVSGHVDALNDEVDALKDVQDTMRANADSTFAVQKARDDLAVSLAEYEDKVAAANQTYEKSNKTAADTARWQAELNGIYSDVALSAAAVADAEKQKGIEFAEANGLVFTAEDQLKNWNRTMLQAAADAKGPARQAVIDFINEANNIPADSEVNIGAVIDEFGLEAALQYVSEQSAAQDAAVKIDADTAAALAKIRTLEQRIAGLVRVTSGTGVVVTGAYSGAYAEGTITKGPELALIGEDGTEAVLPLTKPDRIRALMGEPGVASAILGALSGGQVTAMASGGVVTRGAIRGSGGMSVELRGTSFGDALDTVFSGYASLLGATDSLTEAQHGLNDAFHENGRTLDVNTEKGRANRDAVVSNWEAIKDLAQAQFEQGASVEDVTEAMRGNVAQLRQQIEFFGLAPDQVDAYLASMGATEAAIGQVTAALQEQQRVADVEKQVRTEDYLYSHQQLSADRYLGILRQRLVGLEKYSTEWIRIMDDIDRVEQDKAAAQEQRERDFADRLKKRQDALAEWASGVEDAFARSDDAAEGAQKVAEGLAGVQRAVWEDGIGAGSQGRQSVLDQLNAIADAATARVQAGESIGSVQGSVNADIVKLRRAVVAGGGSAAEFDRLRAQTGRTTSDYGALLRATATQQAIKIDAPITINGSNLSPAQIAAAVQKGIQTAADAAARKLRAA